MLHAIVMLACSRPFALCGNLTYTPTRIPSRKLGTGAFERKGMPASGKVIFLRVSGKVKSGLPGLVCASVVGAGFKILEYYEFATSNPPLRYFLASGKA